MSYIGYDLSFQCISFMRELKLHRCSMYCRLSKLRFTFMGILSIDIDLFLLGLRGLECLPIAFTHL